MSLRVWLPFNGDLTNNGLSATAITPSASSLTYGTGKTCPSAWNSSSAWLKIPYEYADTNEMSICFWVKPNTPNAWSDIFSLGSGANRLEKTESTNYAWYNTSGSALVAGGTIPFAMNNLTWYHVAIVADGANVRFYLNGAIKKTVAQTATLSAVFGDSTDFLISARTTGGGNRYYSFINDFRIYDNALSAKEVKLLSQGLVAHYQLKGMGATNYLKGAGKFTKTTPLVRKASDTSVMNDSYVYHEWEPNALFAVLPSAGTYTISVECDGVGSGHPTSGTTASQRLFSFFLQNTSSGTHYHFTMSQGADGRWYGTRTDLVAGTYKVRTNLYAADEVDYTLKFWDMKVIAGSYNPSDTWCPHEEDELYTTLGLGLGNEPDCSGFGNNATKSGILEVVNDSPRYGRCYRFAGSQYIACGRGAMVTDELTVSCWAYSDNWTNASEIMSCAEGGGWDFWRNGSGQMTMEVRRNGGYITGVYPTALANWSAGWHHLVGVYDGYKAEIYVDGVKGTTSETTTTKYPIQYHESNGLFIAAAAGSSATTPANSYFTGNVSDVRIYGTALSAADVADLYKNAASLTKGGKFMAYDFHENKRNTIDKEGVVATGGFNAKAIPTYDMKVKALGDGSTWARIHHLDATVSKDWFASDAEVAKCIDKHIESTGTQYIDTGVVPTSTTEVEISFTPTGGLTENSIFGSQWSASGYFLMFYQNKVRWHSGGSVVDIGSYKAGDKVVCHCANTYIVVNGVRYNITGGTNTTNPIVLLGDMGAGQTLRGIGRIEYVKMWNNGTLVRDYVSCKYGNSIGLWDKVNSTFYGNSGTDSFTAGYKGGKYQWLDYIQSSGTQYINTGLAENSVYGLKMVFEVPNYAVAWQSLVSGTLDSGFTIGTRDVDLTGFYVRLRGAEVLNSGALISGRATLVIKNGTITVNGAQKATYTSGTLSEKTGNLYIFANNALSRYGNMKLYELEFYGSDGGVLRSYTPCVSPSGKVGLYDKVTKRFYGNHGTGSFIAGTTKESLLLYNRWIQTSSPNISANAGTGFKALTTSWTNYFTPITKSASSSSAVYSMNTANNWWAPIGQKVTFSGGIPAADGSTQYETELWVRTDRFADEDQLNIYNGSITATDYIEI